MKNRWDALKGMYTQWKNLNIKASGLGRDPSTGCISASDEWWQEQNAAMLGCIKFRDAPLENEDDLRIMFDSVCVTNDSSVVPGVGASYENEFGLAEGNTIDGDGDDNVTPKVSPLVEKHGKGKVLHDSPRKNKKQKTFKDLCMKRLADAYELKAQSSKNPTSPAVGHVRQEMSQLIELVIQDGAVEGSDEHYYATQLLMKKEYQDMFMTLKTPSGRLNWLTRAWEDRRKH